MASALADQLSQRGHQVDYFCPQESKTKAHKQSLGYRAFINLPASQQIDNSYIRFQYSIYYSQRMIQDIVSFLQKHPVDIMHFHNVHEALPLLPFIRGIPKVITVHESLFEHEGIFASFHHFCLEQYRDRRDTYFVSISKRQQQGMRTLPFFANVYNGIDTNLFRFQARPKHYLFFSGRFIPEKGVDIALRAAQQARYPMKVAGVFDQRLTVPSDFKRSVTLLLRGSQVDYHGKVSPERLAKYYGGAEALLVPIQWEEPFGLVMVEAMACGTPVIAFKRGAAPELVKDGKTGFIVKTIPEMVRAIKKIPMIRRADCRAHVEKFFSLPVMVQNYEAVYRAAIQKTKQRP